MGCYIWYREEGNWWGCSPPRPILAVPNVIAFPSTTSVLTSYYSMWHYNCLCCLKAAFLYYSQLQTGCKAGFLPRLQAGFRQVRAGLRHAFDQLSTFLSKAWSRTAAGSLVRARARQMEYRKKTVLSKFAAGFRHAFDLLATRFSTRFAAG